MLGSGRVKCPKCGAEAKRGQRFCSECGAGLPTGEVKCGNCGASVPASARFCPNCGHAVVQATAPSMKANRWSRREGDFATRVEVDDVQGFLRRPLVVESGLKALFFAGGRVAGDLPPGTYDMGGILQRIADLGSTRAATVMLVDASDTPMDFWVSGLVTADPIRISAHCEVVIQVADPILFFNNVMKGRQSYAVAELQESLSGEMRNAMQEYVGQHALPELNASVEMKTALQGQVERHLRTTFQRNGLDFVHVRVFEFAHQGVDEILGQREETVLERERQEATAEREVQDVAYYERRAETWDRMRQALTDDRMREIRTEEEFLDFKAEIDKANLIRDDEVAGVVRALGEQTEDHEAAREHLVERLRIERDLERRRIELLGSQDLDGAQVEHEIEMERRRHIADLEARQREQAQDLEEMRGLLGIKRETRDQKLDEERQRLQMEADHLERVSAMGPEALLMAAPPDRAQLIAELRRTEILKGFSEEQILAMAAENSPEVAKAFQEKFSGASSEKVEALYERMLEEKDKAASDSAETQREHARLMSEMFQRGLDAMSQAGRPTTPGGSGRPQAAGGAERVVVCPECHVELPVGTKFCTNCGHKIV